MINLYLYLAKTNLRGIKVVTVIRSPNEYAATMIHDIDSLNLPKEMAEKIHLTVEEHRMYWQLWAETADNFQELQDKLRRRGYINFHQVPIHPFVETRIVVPAIKMPKTMVRRIVT